MGIYIKDMEMPKSCKGCIYFIKRNNLISLDYEYVCINGAKSLLYPNIYENIAYDCPLIEIKEGNRVDGADTD